MEKDCTGYQKKADNGTRPPRFDTVCRRRKTLENDLLFSSAALHEYTRGSAKQNQRKLKQIKNFFIKDDKKKDVYVDSS